MRTQGSTILRTHSTWSGTSKARGPESRMRQRCYSITPLRPTWIPPGPDEASALTPVDAVNIAEATERRLNLHRRCRTLFLEFGQAHEASRSLKGPQQLIAFPCLGEGIYTYIHRTFMQHTSARFQGSKSKIYCNVSDATLSRPLNC